MSFEREIMQSKGKKLGRDNNPKFKAFVNFSESVTSRYIHMASDVLSPHAPAEQNYRRHWVEFCNEKENPSKLNFDMSNEFNKYLEAAAGLIHHHQEIPPFFSDLLELQIDDCPNITLESVVADANDDGVVVFILPAEKIKNLHIRGVRIRVVDIYYQSSKSSEVMKIKRR